MPIYEYACKKCGNEFESLVKNAEEKVSCPKCEGKKVERKLSVFSASVASDGPGSCPAQGQCPAVGSHQCGSSCCHGLG